MYVRMSLRLVLGKVLILVIHCRMIDVVVAMVGAYGQPSGQRDLQDASISSSSKSTPPHTSGFPHRNG